MSRDPDSHSDVERTDYDEKYDERAWEPSDDVEDRRTADGDTVARGTAAGDGDMVYAGGREADDSWLGLGLAGVLILAGIVLFLVPEPATSVTGVFLMLAGVVVWFVTEMR